MLSSNCGIQISKYGEFSKSCSAESPEKMSSVNDGKPAFKRSESYWRRAKKPVTAFSVMFAVSIIGTLPAQAADQADLSSGAKPVHAKVLDFVGLLADLVKKSVGAKCDQLAGDPNDPQESGAGVPIEQLDSPAAIKACTQAVEISPVARYRYQLARALVKDFEVAERFEGKPAEVNFQKALGGTDPELLRSFESHIREKAAEGPNFAGQFTVTTFPCGTMCEGFAIVSAVDGSVYVPPEGSSMGVLFRRDANYLIVNPIDESNEEEKELQDTNSIKTRFYRWDGQKLSEVTSATPELIAEAQKTALAQNLNIANSEGVAALNQGDYATAFYKFRWAAEQGHTGAQNDLGNMYEMGHGVPQDYTEAVKWYRKAADQSYVMAQQNLGRMYELGRGLQQDDKEAENWYQRAADQGHPEAGQRFNIARGKRLVVGTKCDQLAGDPDDPQKIGAGVPIDQLDSAAAIEACKQAVDVSPLARYQFQLGRALAKEVKLTEALHWNRKAAEWGYGAAQQSLGLFYEVGLGGVEQDDAEAMKWYRKAADQGLASAQATIGSTYEHGKDVPQDYAEAMKWYRKAADQGHRVAQYFIGKMYLGGRGVPEDDAEAMKWFRKAADQGVPEAQHALGVGYAAGRGVAQDHAEALKWLRLSAAQGDENAKEFLHTIGLNW